MQMGDLGREDSFNYELQYTRFLPEERTVRNGDVLTTTCIFDSMDRTEVTPGGLGSQEEMCVNFLTVYPASCCTPLFLFLFWNLLLLFRRLFRHPTPLGLRRGRNPFCVWCGPGIDFPLSLPPLTPPTIC